MNAGRQARSPHDTICRVLVVDDEVELMRALCDALRDAGYEVDGYSDPVAALEAVRAGGFGVLLSDLMMPGTTGIELLRQARELAPTLVGVIMTGQGTAQTGAEVMRAGAFDYVRKPFRLQQLRPILDRALATHQLRAEAGGLDCNE